MKVNASKFYSIIFSIVLLLQLYLPSFKANAFIQIGVLILFFSLERITVSRNMLRTVIPVLVLIGIGFVAPIFHRYSLGYVIKDIFHFLKPLLGIMVGYFFYRRIGNFKTFLKILIVLGFISALIHLVVLGFFSRTGTVSDIREFSKDNFLELFSLFFLGFYRKFSQDTIFRKKSIHYLFMGVMMISGVLYFSRTMMVMAVLIWMSLMGYTKITRSTLMIMGSLLCGVLLLYAYLFSIKIDRGSKGIESFFYKVKLAPAELFQTKIDRDNHAELWDHWRGYEAKRAKALMDDTAGSYLFGCGYGSRVDLKFYAPLTAEDKGMRYISELHNGYMYIFYKTGLIGILVYLGFLFALYRRITQRDTFVSRLISGIGLAYFFTTITISGLYNSRDIMVFILGALLVFEKNLTFPDKLVA